MAELFLQPLADRLESISLEALYGLIFLASFVEGVLPPVPGDAAAAFLAFLSARAGGLWFPTTLAVTLGSVGGNSIVWWLGRRYGSAWITRKLSRFTLTKKPEEKAEQLERVEQRLEEAYRQYGWMALFLSRFIPGFRAVSPAAAGALGVPLWETMAVLFAAAAIWYSAITWIAFKVGSDWEDVKAALTRFAQGAGVGALVLVLVLGLLGWWLWRRRRARLEGERLAAERGKENNRTSADQ